MISKGNKKTGIPSFSIHNTVCKNIRGCQAQDCFKYCYANKAIRMYPQTRALYARNLDATFKDNFVSLMNEELQDYPIRYFRIHVCGEFYSQDYLNKWFQIATKNPEITFFTYTKNIDLDFSLRPDNMVIHLSNDNNLKEFSDNKDRFDGMTTIKEKGEDTPKEFTGCLNQTQGFTCARCKLCTKKDTNVCFIKH